MEKLLLNRKEAASLLSISVQSIDKLVHQGRLKCVRVGKRLLIPPEALQEFAVGQNISSPHAVVGR
jgi:excisionase family DNA binding protein